MPVERTPEGYLRIPAAIARHGMYDYLAMELRAWGVPLDDAIPDDAILKVYRDSNEVFDTASMRTFEHKPLTKDHPSELVSPETVNRDMIGMSLAPVQALDNGNDIGVDVQIMSADGIRDYERGTRELSAGYQSTLVLEPGMTADGQPYDMRQTKIIGNHIALVERGRAGTARLLDKETKDMDPSSKIDPIEHGKVKQQLADAEATIADLRKQNDELSGQNAALKDAQLTDEQVKEKVDAGVRDALVAMKARKDVLDRAKRFAPKLKDSGQPLRDLMVEAIKARGTSLDLADKSEDFVRGIFESMPSPAKAAGGFHAQHTDSEEVIANPADVLSFDELAKLIPAGLSAVNQ